ncbi:MAG: DUF86 domain-containing protein [Alphaproteobacteria bacterium]
MTAPRDYRDFLADMVIASRAIIDFAGDLTLDAYLADRKTCFAVMRGFEMLGEAVRHVPPEIKEANLEIPWGVMAAVRNRIVHGYFGVDDTILYVTAQDELRALLPRLERLARDQGVDV